MKVYILTYHKHGIINERVFEAEENQWLVVDGNTLGIPRMEGRVYKEDGKIYTVSEIRAEAFAALLDVLKKKRVEILKEVEAVVDDIEAVLEMRDEAPPALSK